MLQRSNAAIYEVTQGLNLMNSDRYSIEDFEIGYGSYLEIDRY